MSVTPLQPTTGDSLKSAGSAPVQTEVEPREQVEIPPPEAADNKTDVRTEKTTAPADEIATSDKSHKLIAREERSQSDPSAEKIPIHLFDEESRLKKLSYVGPVILGGASIILTLVVWGNTKTLTQRQIELQDKQTQLQEEQVRAAEADMRTKFFNDLTSTDGSKRTFAAIGLAGHGRKKAMPVVHFALGVERREVRQGAVEVVHMLFQAEMTVEGRRQLITELQNEFSSPNSTLHVGVTQSLVGIQPLMNSDERRQVMQFFEQRVTAETRCADSVGREIVQETAKFSSTTDPASVPYLLTILRVPRCGFGWQQAIQKLVELAANLQTPERAKLRKQLEHETMNVLKNLRTAVSDEELEQTSGFGILGNEKTVSYEQFRKKVEQQCDRLSQALSEP